MNPSLISVLIFFTLSSVNSQNTYNVFYTSFFQYNRDFLHGFGNGYARKSSALSSRCATNDAQYDFFGMTGQKALGIFKFQYLDFQSISSDINENFWLGVTHLPFKLEYLLNPIEYFAEFSDRFWIGIKELRFKLNYIKYDEVKLNFSNYWIQIQTILSKCGGSIFIQDMNTFLNKSWVEITTLYLFRFTLLIPLYLSNIFFYVYKVFTLDFYGIGYLVGDFSRRIILGYSA